MTTFTKGTADGTLSVDIHIPDHIETFSGESLLELAEMLTETAKWIRTMVESEEPDEVARVLKLKGES